MRTTWRWRTSVATFYPRSLSMSTRDRKFVLYLCVSNAFSLNFFVKSLKLSIFSMSLLYFKQRWEERPFSLVTSNPSTCDNRPATFFCKDVFPSNRWKWPQPEIAILTLQTWQKSSTDVRKILTGVRENVAKTAIKTMFSRSYIFTHRCATCNQMSAVRFNGNKHASHGAQNRFGEIFHPEITWKWGSVLLWPEAIFFSSALCTLLTRLRREISIRKKYPLVPRVSIA